MSASAEVTYSPVGASIALAGFALLAPTVPQRVEGVTFANALMGALHSAELIAARVGVSPVEAGPDGTARVRIGAALAGIDRAPEPVRTIYLATFRAVHEATESARPLAGSEAGRLTYTPPPSPSGANAAIQAIVVAVVVGVVALSVWGIAREGARAIEVGGEALRQVVIANRAAEMQARGVAPDADSWRVLQALAAKEVPGRGLGDVGPGVVLALLAAAGVVMAWRLATGKA